MNTASDLEALLATVVDHHERHGVLPPDLPPTVAAMAARYLELTMLLDDGASVDQLGRLDARRSTRRARCRRSTAFARSNGSARGGMGEVYKLQDLKLDRIVAGKIIRRDRAGQLSAATRHFLREAKSLALFSDPRIVQIFECRLDTDPAVIIMEYVDGFELGRLGPSLELRQRATVDARSRRCRRSRARARHPASRPEAVEHHARRRAARRRFWISA